MTHRKKAWGRGYTLHTPISHVISLTVSSESLLTAEQVQATVELAKRAKEACQNVSSEHKDIHTSISKFGRAIDKVCNLYNT